MIFILGNIRYCLYKARFQERSIKWTPSSISFPSTHPACVCVCADAQTVSLDTRGKVWGAPRQVAAGKAGGNFKLSSPHMFPQGHPAWACLILRVPPQLLFEKKDSITCISLGVIQVERAGGKQFVSSHGWVEGSGVGCTSWPLHSWVSIIHPPPPPQGMKSQHPT